MKGSTTPAPCKSVGRPIGLFCAAAWGTLSETARSGFSIRAGQKAIDGAASKEMVYWKRLFTSRSWHLLVPDQRHEVVTEGLGELRGLDTLMAARTSHGATVMAYMPTSRATTVDLSKLSGRRRKV